MADPVLKLVRLIPNGFPGKTRFARWVLNNRLIQSPANTTDRSGCCYAVPDLREPIAFQLAVDGVYEPDTLSFILSHLGAGSVLVDVGANIGVFALPAAQRVGKKGRVLAIEASPEVFPYLKSNVAVNGLNQVTCLEFAASSTDGEVEFFPAPADHFGMGSLGAQFDGKTVAVRAATLDRLLSEAGIDRVDVLKVDVEGFELAVFQGSQRLLTGVRPPLLIFEFCDWAEARVPGRRVGDAQRHLLSLGFSLWRLEDFTTGRPPLKSPILSGFGMLVGKR